MRARGKEISYFNSSLRGVLFLAMRGGGLGGADWGEGGTGNRWFTKPILFISKTEDKRAEGDKEASRGGKNMGGKKREKNEEGGLTQSLRVCYASEVRFWHVDV